MRLVNLLATQEAMMYLDGPRDRMDGEGCLEYKRELFRRLLGSSGIQVESGLLIYNFNLSPENKARLREALGQLGQIAGAPVVEDFDRKQETPQKVHVNHVMVGRFNGTDYEVTVAMRTGQRPGETVEDSISKYLVKREPILGSRPERPQRLGDDLIICPTPYATRYRAHIEGLEFQIKELPDLVAEGSI